MMLVRRLFLFAAIYGLVIIVPMFFLEPCIDQIDPPAIVHPEFYYGFLGAAAAWQWMYYIVSRDPARYRAMIPPAIFAKMSFVVAVVALFALERASVTVLAAVAGDLVFAVLFAYAYVLLGRDNRG
jgi:hypothetical protein